VSTAQSRSWRPENRGRRRGERKRKLVFVSVLIGIISAVFLWFLWPRAVPVTHFGALVDVADGPDETGFTAKSMPSATANSDSLLLAFEQLQKQNFSLVANPVELDRHSSDVFSALSDVHDKRLILYCAVQGRLESDTSDRERPIVVLGTGQTGGKQLTLSLLLQQIKALKCTTVVLLLEFSGVEGGLYNGIIDDNLMREVRVVVSTSKVPSLTVLCACDSGQQSWEYFREEDSQSKPAPAGSDGAAAGDTSATFVTPQLYSGTAFGHFVGEALFEGRVDTPNDLFEFVRDGVDGWVSEHHGARQSVVLINGSRKASQRSLLDRVTSPNRTTPDADSTAAEQASADSDDAASSDGPPAASVVQDDSPGAKLQKLLAVRDSLKEQAVVPVIQPAEWLRLQSLLFHLEQAVLSGNHPQFSSIHDAAQKLLVRMQESPTGLNVVDSDTGIGNWLCMRTPVPTEQVASFKELMSKLSAESTPETPIRLSAEQRGLPFLKAFSNWLVGDLEVQSKRLSNLPADEKSKRVAGWRRALSRATNSGWRTEDLPHQMVTLVEALTESIDAEWHVELMEPLMRLVVLREQALQLAIGTLDRGVRIRRQNWKSIADDISQVLTRLVAAESWLKRGRSGLEPAVEELQSAEELLRQIRRSVEESEGLLAIQDAQFYSFPFLIELLAAAQERIPLTENELRAAQTMAEAVTTGASPESLFPDGLLTAMDFRREHVEAMFALTRDFSADPVNSDDRQHSDRLWAYVNRKAAEAPTGWVRHRLLEVPILAEFRERESLLRSIGRETAAPPNRVAAGRQNTGLWMSFWSIRMLAALGSDPGTTASLWSQWAELAKELKFADPEVDGESVAPGLMQQTALATRLRAEWIRLCDAKKSAGHENTSFVGLEDSRALLMRELERHERISGSPAVRKVLTELLDGRNPTQTDQTPPLNLDQQAIEVGADGTAVLPLTVSGSADIFLLAPDFEIVDVQSRRRGPWQSPVSGSAALQRLRLRPRRALSGPVTIPIVALDSDAIVTLNTEVVVHPSSDSDWQIEFLSSDGKRLTAVVAPGHLASHEQYYLDLPGNTWISNAGKKVDTPVALNVRLRRTKGIADKVSVQLFRVAGEETEAVWPGPLELDIDPQSATVPLPLLPPAESTEPAPAPTPVDLSSGFVFRIQPLDVLTQTESFIEFIPRFYLPTQYVKVPSPQWNSETNELVIDVARADATPLLKPQKVALKVHLSPELEALKIPPTATTVPDLKQGSRHEFRFQFNSQINRKLGNTSLLSTADANDVETGGLEFSLSVAGTPHIWRWRLGASGIELLNERKIPDVRVELMVENDDRELKPWEVVPELKLSGDWKNARFRAVAQIYGGDLSETVDWQLFYSLRERRSPQRVEVFRGPLQHRRFVESVRAAVGENNAWLLSTDTSLHESDTFQLQSDGYYDLIASIKRNVPGQDPIETRVSFVADSTPPEFQGRGVSFSGAPTRDTQDIQGAIHVQDLESGIASVKVGLAPDALQAVRNLSADGDIKFRISRAEFPEIVQKETDNFKRLQVYVQITNGVGLPVVRPFSTEIYRKGIPANTRMDDKPGGLTVNIKSASAYRVTITGPKSDSKVGKKIVSFDGLPPGRYQVKWHVENRPAYGAGQKTIMISSGKFPQISTGK
jgi:hypothetical protein